MSKFGFLRIGTKDKVERIERKLAKKKDKEPEESTISNALEEIEAEESIPDIEGIEDELIQLEEKAIMTHEPSQEPLPLELPKKIDEIDEKISHFDDVLHDMKDDSSQFHDQLGEMEDTMRKLISTYEEPSRASRPFKAKRDEENEFPVFAKGPRHRREEFEAPRFLGEDELPPFQPRRFKESRRTPSREKTAVMELPEFRPARMAHPLEPEEQPSEIKVTVNPNLFKPEDQIKSQPQIGQQQASLSSDKTILTHIKHDYLTLVLVMRWIEFLFERTVRDKLSLVLDYYRDIGWINDEVKSEILSYARGEMQDVTKYLAQEEAKDILPADVTPNVSYKKVDDWRMSADDHLKSLLFIMKIANVDVDRDRLNSLEQIIQKFKEDLRNFHGI